MRKLENAVTLFTLAGLLFGAGTTSAQDPRDAGVFADEAGTQSMLAVVAFQTFDIHAIAFGLDGDIAGFEFQFTGMEGITILGVTTWGDGAPTIDYDPTEWIWPIGYCVPADPAGPFVMVTLHVGSFSDPTGDNLIDKAICMRGATPSSFAEFGSPPGWLRCDGTLDMFGVAQNGSSVYPDGCMILNPTSQESVLSSESTSFGTMKTRY